MIPLLHENWCHSFCLSIIFSFCSVAQSWVSTTRGGKQSQHLHDPIPKGKHMADILSAPPLQLPTMCMNCTHILQAVLTDPRGGHAGKISPFLVSQHWGMKQSISSAPLHMGLKQNDPLWNFAWLSLFTWSLLLFCPISSLLFQIFAGNILLINQSYFISHLKFCFRRTQTKTIRMLMYKNKGDKGGKKKAHLIDFLLLYYNWKNLPLFPSVQMLWK